MTHEAHPIEAAERRQYVAPGASPGISALSSVSTVGATDSVGSFAPTGLDLKNNMFPGLTPGASSLSVAQSSLTAYVLAKSCKRAEATRLHT